MLYYNTVLFPKAIKTMSHFTPKSTFLSQSAGARLFFVGVLLAAVWLLVLNVLS